MYTDVIPNSSDGALECCYLYMFSSSSFFISYSEMLCLLLSCFCLWSSTCTISLSLENTDFLPLTTFTFHFFCSVLNAFASNLQIVFICLKNWLELSKNTPACFIPSSDLPTFILNLTTYSSNSQHYKITLGGQSAFLCFRLVVFVFPLDTIIHLWLIKLIYWAVITFKKWSREENRNDQFDFMSVDMC